jgi:peptidoglycan/LPS O-acetylase OafA/YrhL
MLFCSIERIKPVIPAGFTAGCALLLVLLLASTSQPQLMGLASILTGLLIGGLYLSDGGLNRLLGNPPMRMLGNASYALYLLQMAGHGAAVAWLPEPLGRALALPLTVLAALLVLRWIEEPARKAILGHRPVTVQT